MLGTTTRRFSLNPSLPERRKKEEPWLIISSTHTRCVCVEEGKPSVVSFEGDFTRSETVHRHDCFSFDMTRISFRGQKQQFSWQTHVIIDDCQANVYIHTDELTEIHIRNTHKERIDYQSLLAWFSLPFP